MLKYVDYDIVFQEVPGEITLAINLSCCPNNCIGCHSPHLRMDIGTVLDETVLSFLTDRYSSAITCVCFMGGDGDPQEVSRLAAYVKRLDGGAYKTGWYSGKENLPEGFDIRSLDFIKLGPYIARYGGLDKPTTNQRFYRIVDGRMEDCTRLFLKHG